ncbi:MAG TPA: hypothetical protein ENF34_04300 [Candidatus Bathyarchaeota archaeon]|nr:hypothetical protein [Candidatus Bathyarchaeota archaeon]
MSMGLRRPIEGFLLLLASGHIFEVKGLLHPPDRVVAYPKYVLDPSGDRELQGRRYRKLGSLREKMKFLKKRMGHYLVHDPVLDEVLCEPPISDVARVLDPVEGLEELRKAGDLSELGLAALELADEVSSRAKLGRSDVGVSGSILAGLEGPSSDIDLVFYGEKACLEAYTALRSMREEGITKPLDLEDLRAIFLSRSKDTKHDLASFFARERGKVLQGKFKGFAYSIRMVPARGPEPYGAIRFRKLGVATVKATVADASRSIFTPCTYRLRHVELTRGMAKPSSLVSFRMRFCEHAREGERVMARGKLEEVLGPQGPVETRLLVGGLPGDYLIPLGREARAP